MEYNKTVLDKNSFSPSITTGINKIADIVSRTLGPGGLPILLERKGTNSLGEPFPPLITKDGVTVANAAYSVDPMEDLVIQTVKAICQKTNQLAGDGPQPLYSKVLTPTGFVPMGELKIGTEICGTNGTFQRVLGIFPKGEKEIYKVEFGSGKVVECCANHLWTITDAIYNKTTQKTTLELFKDYVKFDKFEYPRHRYYVMNTLVEFTENKEIMPLDPYLLGVLLGGGNLSRTGTVELSLDKNKEHILNKLNPPKGIKINTTYIEDRNYFQVNLVGMTEAGQSIEIILNSLGLLGVLSKTKFIPKAYLYSSKESRKALLRGLIDTNGYVNSKERFEFSTSSPNLLENFIELTRSLGIPVISRLYEKTEKSKSHSLTPIYRIMELKGYKHGDKIVKITPTNEYTSMQCIKVSNPDNLYITNDYTVTHNTTSAIVLGRAILKEAFNVIENNKEQINPQILRDEIDLFAKEIIKQISNSAIKIQDLNSIKNIATISANGDSEIGEIIKEAFEKVGAEGVITVDEGHSAHTTIDIVNGFQIKKGAQSGDRFFNTKERTKFEAENTFVLIYDGNLRSYHEIIPFFTCLQNAYKEQGKRGLPSILIIANEFSLEVLQFLLIQKVEVNLQVCAIESPHVTTVRTAMLDDIAILLNGYRFGNGNRNLDSVTYDDIGFCKKVTSDKYSTTLYDGAGSEESIIERVDQLKEARKIAESPYDAQILSERIGALSGGVAKIGVGGSTDLEIKERYHRIEDALNAARAAVEEGIVPGGGISYLRAVNEAFNQLGVKTAGFGQKVLLEALKSPFLQILENIGLSSESSISLLSELLNSEDKTSTYDARNKKIVAAIDAGIIDPAKVLRIALENAVSVASLLSTCGGAIIYNRNEDSNERIQSNNELLS